MKIYEVRSKGWGYPYTFLVKDTCDVKDYLKNDPDAQYIDADLRTLKRREIPTGTHMYPDLSGVVYLMYDGRLVAKAGY